MGPDPRAFIILFPLLLGACATQFALRDSSEQRLTMFSQVVFAPDYDSRRTDYLAKWTTPLRIALKGDKKETSREARVRRDSVRDQARALAELTGLDIALAISDKPSNVTIYFAEIENMEALAGSRIRNRERMRADLLSTGCHFQIEKDSDNRITGAVIFARAEKIIAPISISSGTPVRKIKPCLAQNLTRILGFPNISEVIQPSIFNANAQLKQPTAVDLKFIRALYAPVLKPGMPRRKALSAIEAFLQ